jgi:hypothetical protein
MPIYLNYMEVASYVLGLVALVCGFVTISEVPNAKTMIRLVGWVHTIHSSDAEHTSNRAAAL